MGVKITVVSDRFKLLSDCTPGDLIRWRDFIAIVLHPSQNHFGSKVLHVAPVGGPKDRIAYFYDHSWLDQEVELLGRLKVELEEGQA